MKVIHLQDKIRELRNLINSSICYKQSTWERRGDGDWSKLWVAVDSIEDTQLAIEEYLSLNSFSRLAIYGLLQSMYVQQDAIAHLEKAIVITVPDWKKKYPGLSNIRDIRNETIGHPISEKGTYSTISRTSNLTVLEYGVWSKNNYQRKKIYLYKIIDTQRELLVNEINRIIKKINFDEIKHMRKHSRTSLVNILNQTDYFIQKLWSFEKVRDYSKINLDFLESVYEEFKIEIKMRYKVDNLSEYGIQIPGLIFVFQKVDKLIPKIRTMVLMNNNIEEFELDVYVDSLYHSFVDLRKMAKEIDDQFSTKK